MDTPRPYKGIGLFLVGLMEGHAGTEQEGAEHEPAGLGISAQTLAADLFVSGGGFEARPFPAPRPLDESDGYEDLAPYLGAKGHLVVLREGDLAFLHVHPEDHEAVAEEIEFTVVAR
jgi:hypothetical protein